jgi:hypothetical protein
MVMNKTGKTSLRAMKKDELTEFSWNLIQDYDSANEKIESLKIQIAKLKRTMYRITCDLDVALEGEEF